MIKGKKVVLRKKRAEDAANDYAWRCDPEMARLDATAPLSMSFRDFLLSHTDELCYPSPRRQRFAIDTLDGKHIGNCMYYDIDEKRRQAELGILIGDRAYWDQGYGAEAVNALLEHIFSATRLQRVYLCTLDWNVRAQKSFAKCGFTPCGRLLRDGYNFIVLEVFRDTWRNQASTLLSKGAKEEAAP